jgi:hypothetical protein
LQWSASAEWDVWSRHSEGCYVLRTNVTDWTPEVLWQTYVQLTEAEAAFRTQKSDLRPIWYHKQHRVQAHIFVCFPRARSGRPSSNGRSALASVTARARFSSSSGASRAPMSCCRWRATRSASSVFGASCAPIARRPRCSTGWDYGFPIAFGCPGAPAKCVPTFDVTARNDSP